MYYFRFFLVFALLILIQPLVSYAGSGSDSGNKDKNGVECNIEIKFDYAVDELNVAFNNVSLGNYDLLLWDFGDQSTSREANPQHTYKEEGSYNFCLTAINIDRQCENKFCGEIYLFK